MPMVFVCGVHAGAATRQKKSDARKPGQYDCSVRHGTIHECNRRGAFLVRAQFYTKCAVLNEFAHL